MIAYICTGDSAASSDDDIEVWLLEEYDPLRATFARDTLTSISNARAIACEIPSYPVSHAPLGEPVLLERAP